MKQQKEFIIAILLSLVITGCKNSWDEYYARPEGLEGPVYKQLETDERFTMFTSCLELTGYSDILGRTGYFTVFAPNDQAFQQFLQERGLTAVEQLDTMTVKLIVQYSIVDNGYTKRQLAAYQSSKGWVYGNAFKRMTRVGQYLSKDSVYDYYQGKNIEVYFINNTMDADEKKYKYIPYFIDEYFTANNLSASDYETFFPNTAFTGFNIVNSSVIGEVIIAENGYIYELDHVNLPLPNIDELLAGHPRRNNYSLFKNILDRLYTPVYDSLISPYYPLPVFYKEYSSGLSYMPNDENWIISSGEPNSSQTNGWTLFVPDNNAMQQFFNEKLLVHYSSVDQILYDRGEILIDFVNAHMFRKAIWPGKFQENTQNFGLTLSQQQILDADVASNGFLYGINTVLQSGNIFQSVFSEIYLNPDYSMMYRAINNIDENKSLKNILTSREIQYTLLAAHDTAFENEGFEYNNVQDYFEQTANPGINANLLFSPVFLSHILRGSHEDLSGTGFLETINGRYIKYDNNRLWGGGNMEANDPVTVTGRITTSNNGIVYLIDKAVLPAQLSLTGALANPPEGASYLQFYQYLSNSGIIIDGLINGIAEGHSFTVLVPTDSAITMAGLPAYNTTVSEEKDTIQRFLYYHVIPDKSIFTDAKITGEAKTLLFAGYSGRLKLYEPVTIGGTAGDLIITDKTGSQVHVKNTAGSNRMTSGNGVILQIDGILKTE